jgi:hypothetical protein
LYQMRYLLQLMQTGSDWSQLKGKRIFRPFVRKMYEKAEMLQGRSGFDMLNFLL